MAQLGALGGINRRQTDNQATSHPDNHSRNALIAVYQSCKRQQHHEAVFANAYVDGEFEYQLITLGLAGTVLLFTFLLGPTNFRKTFSLGKINAPVEPVKRIGLPPKPGEGWLQIGRNLAVIISAVTLVLIYLQAIRGNSIATPNLRYLPWILVSAIASSFVDEVITRFAVVSALDGLLPNQLLWDAGWNSRCGIGWFPGSAVSQVDP